MRKGLVVSLLVWAVPGAVFAAESGASLSGSGGMFFAVTVVTVGFALAISTLCAALGQGYLAGRAMEAIARQPEAGARIQTAMLLGLAFIESLVIYVLLIAFILLFLNPFAKHFVG